MSTRFMPLARRLRALALAHCSIMVALAGCSIDEWSGASVNVGPVAGFPPGIVRVAGTCSGKIALTPGSTLEEDDSLSYPVIYNCGTKLFTILEPAGSRDDGKDYADLNLTADGHYVNEYMRIGRQRYGGYSFFDRGGKRIGRLERPELDPHELLVGSDSLTYFKYTTPRRTAAEGHACGTFPVELEIVEESLTGKVAWTWDSTGKLDPGWGVTADSLKDPAPGRDWRGRIESARHCYSTLLKNVLSIKGSRALEVHDDAPLFEVSVNDYIHANSLSRVGAAGDILVSARHMDSIFVIDRKSGDVKWALGGPKARMPARRPVGDPRGGFSHQHSAFISGNGLHVFDNGNNFPDRPSRAVIYTVDPSNLDSAEFRFEFPEPNGRRRPASGSVQDIGNGRILIGWGDLAEKDMAEPARAVSIVDTSTGKEEFLIDFAPGWSSYRARYFTEN